MENRASFGKTRRHRYLLFEILCLSSSITNTPMTRTCSFWFGNETSMYKRKLYMVCEALHLTVSASCCFPRSRVGVRSNMWIRQFKLNINRSSCLGHFSMKFLIVVHLISWKQIHLSSLAFDWIAIIRLVLYSDILENISGKAPGICFCQWINTCIALKLIV